MHAGEGVACLRSRDAFNPAGKGGGQVALWGIR